MEVCFPSTAANYFHLLRTHMRMPFRKPLIVVSPKKLLRLKGACSTAEDFVDGQRFKPVIEDKHPELLPGDQVTKVLLCSGQVYYDLEDER
jgi:2-oxoglutarate dehydrogenase complex dehydrogenase (E1) component-like enzyme